MPVFQIINGSVRRIDVKQEGFRLERELHELFHRNLENLLGVRPVEKEYPISAQLGRIDTLGLDENNAPVIIEFKLDTSGDVLDQGLFYYKWLLENRAHFELLVRQLYGPDVKVNWEQPRLILIAQRFGRYTVAAAEPFGYVDLIRYSQLEDNLLVLDKVTGPHTWRTPGFALSTSGEDVPSTPSGEYSFEYHLAHTTSDLHEPFLELRNFLLSFGDIEERTQQKSGITYRTTRSIAIVQFLRNSVDILLHAGAANDDPDQRLEDIRKYAWGYPWRFRIRLPADATYAKRLIAAAYAATQ